MIRLCTFLLAHLVDRGIIKLIAMDITSVGISAVVILAGLVLYRVVRAPYCPVCTKRLWTWSYGVYKCDPCKKTFHI